MSATGEVGEVDSLKVRLGGVELKWIVVGYAPEDDGNRIPQVQRLCGRRCCPVLYRKWESELVGEIYTDGW